MNPFVAMLIIFAPIFLIFGFINFLRFKNWTLIYTALNDEVYMRTMGKLKNAGIKYKTKSLTNQTNTMAFGGDSPRHYEIYVRPKDVYQANASLHTKA